jgi:hypothetical protein
MNTKPDLDLNQERCHKVQEVSLSSHIESLAKGDSDGI